MTKESIDASDAPLMDHLNELRKRLMLAVAGFVVALLVCFYYSTEILHILIKPFYWGTGKDITLISIKLLGVFFVKLKIAMFGGLFIAFPLIATQIYRFVAPGLYKHERAVFAPYLIATPICFLMGASLVYFMLLPFAIKFFFAVGADAGITVMPDIEPYLDFVMTLILAFGLTFQLPVVLTLLGQLGIVSHAQLSGGRRFAFVGVAAVAALITPPDPFSMLAMMIPLGLLYELAVWAVWLIEKRKAKASDSTDVTPT
jgi:sec-independent protein translocase protein TatC